MKGESTESRLDVTEIANELRQGRLSRAGLVDLLKGVGLGFGAAFVLGVAGAQAATAPDAAVTVKSTNPAINNIIGQVPQAPVAGVAMPPQQVAYYHRYYHRYYTRYYNRY
jgi:hypothetical protein